MLWSLSRSCIVFTTYFKFTFKFMRYLWFLFRRDNNLWRSAGERVPWYRHRPCGGYCGVGIGPANRNGVLGWAKLLWHTGKSIFISFSRTLNHFNLFFRLPFVLCHYCMQWGEGAGGGWFRLALGKDTLNIESHRCTWAVPARADVERAMQQFDDSCIS